MGTKPSVAGTYDIQNGLYSVLDKLTIPPPPSPHSLKTGVHCVAQASLNSRFS